MIQPVATTGRKSNRPPHFKNNKNRLQAAPSYGVDIKEVSPTEYPAPALVVGSCVYAEPPLSSLALFGGAARLKEPEMSSKTPPDEIQSCQAKS